MRLHHVCFVLILSLTVPAAFLHAQNDLYWVSFSGDSDADPIYLMQISERGTITIQPKIVIRSNRFGMEKGVAALSRRGKSKLNLYAWGESEDLYRAVIDKRTLAVKNVKKIQGVEADDDDHLNITDRRSNNFLLAELETGSLDLVPLNRRGLPTGAVIKVASTLPRFNDKSSLSSDGLMLLSARFVPNVPNPPKEVLYAVALDENGEVLSQKKLIQYENIKASDVSDPLEDGNRFAVYITRHPEARVVLQVITSNGRKIGDPIILADSKRNARYQNVAIDPLGRFVIFTTAGDEFGCPDQDVLVYQRLNSTGEPRARVKVLATCGLVTQNIEGISLLKD